MTTLRNIAQYVRSKNAGPFWVTIDVFCANDRSYRSIIGAAELQAAAIALRFGIDAENVRRFELPSLQVLKLSFPRTASQGSTTDRDCHAAQLFVSLLDIEIDDSASTRHLPEDSQ